MFPVNFVKFLRAIFLNNVSGMFSDISGICSREHEDLLKMDSTTYFYILKKLLIYKRASPLTPVF